MQVNIIQTQVQCNAMLMMTCLILIKPVITPGVLQHFPLKEISSRDLKLWAK
jgi:hypothetical protein